MIAPALYRGWCIRQEFPPIPGTYWSAVGPNYDASWEGEESGWIASAEGFMGNSFEEVCELIDEWFEDNGDGA